jgi:anaerobic selenocysteine-containing dehydrogenase
VKIRGDKAHPASRGYACEKPHRLNFYQNASDRLRSPLRRRSDGSFEEIDWDTAISEIAARLSRVREDFGGESIFYYGGGGQGNHLPGAYASATRRALGSRYLSGALAQEKTGEFWISHRMLGTMTRADFEHCDVALFIGKNPWHSHSLARARVVLKEIAKDPERKMIVIDPRLTETAKLADIHLQVRPGTDAWLLSAMVGVLVQEQLCDLDFLAEHASGYQEAMSAFAATPVADFCARCGVEEELVREATRLVAAASRAASIEDLGVQMNRHSTLVSYLHRLLVFLTGNIGKPGTHYVPSGLVNFFSGEVRRRSPVAGARIVGGLVPCNVIAEEILSDHDSRYRAMIVEATNPAHSLADSKQFREALRALDTLVVIDVALTETAREADYVLPASTQFEKAEATFFNFEFPSNYFHLRRALLPAPAGPLPEAEIHARLCEALGAIDEQELAPLHEAAKQGLEAYGAAFMTHVMPHKRLMGQAPVILYRTLGPTLPEGTREGAVLFGLAFQFAMKNPGSLKRAGFEGNPGERVRALFEACINEGSGFVFSVDGWDKVFKRISTADKKIEFALDDMLETVKKLATERPTSPPDAFPLVLSAGERRSFTANTIIRNPDWRQKDESGSLRMSPADAATLGVCDGDVVVLITKRDRAEVRLELSESMQPGHISLPNGLGLNDPRNGDRKRHGVAPNELTAAADRDPFVGTPWHKFVRARVEALAPRE